MSIDDEFEPGTLLNFQGIELSKLAPQIFNSPSDMINSYFSGLNIIDLNNEYEETEKIISKDSNSSVEIQCGNMIYKMRAKKYLDLIKEEIDKFGD